MDSSVYKQKLMDLLDKNNTYKEIPLQTVLENHPWKTNIYKNKIIASI